MGGCDLELLPGLAARVYGVRHVRERHGNRYEVELSYVAPLGDKGFLMTGRCVQGGYPEVFEYRDHPYYLSVIYHPEFLSRPNKPHPLFTALIEAAMRNREGKLS